MKRPRRWRSEKISDVDEAHEIDFRGDCRPSNSTVGGHEDDLMCDVIKQLFILQTYGASLMGEATLVGLASTVGS